MSSYYDPSDIPEYAKLMRPSTNRKSTWNHFGFPSNANGTILSRQYIICCRCFVPFRFTKDSLELAQHLEVEHPGALQEARPGKQIADANIEVVLQVEQPSRRSNRQRVKKEIMEQETLVESEEEQEFEDDIDSVEYLIPEPMQEDDDDDDGECGEEDIEETLDWVASSGVNIPESVDLKPDPPLTVDLAEMCIEDLVMPELVDGTGFGKLISKLSPGSQIPNSQHVWNAISRLYEDKINSPAAQLQKALAKSAHFALGIDWWSNLQSEPFYSFSVYLEAGSAFKDVMTLPKVDPFNWKEQLTWLDLKLCSAVVINFKANVELVHFMKTNGTIFIELINTFIHLSY